MRADEREVLRDVRLRALAEDYGFVETGATEPLESNPALAVRELQLA